MCRLCIDRGGAVDAASTGGYGRSVPRPPRPQVAGGIYHVTCRGNRKQAAFRDPDDHRFQLWCLERVAARYDWRVLTYVHMTNHFHITVVTEEPTISRGMQWLNGVYAQVFNKREALAGHLFQGRFHSTLIESDGHLLECTRYDVLNPWRAGLCDHPLAWRWSSLRATLGISPKPLFLDSRRLLSMFSRRQAEARRLYLQFVEEGMHDAPGSGLRAVA